MVIPWFVYIFLPLARPRRRSAVIIFYLNIICNFTIANQYSNCTWRRKCQLALFMFNFCRALWHVGVGERVRVNGIINIIFIGQFIVLQTFWHSQVKGWTLRECCDTPIIDLLEVHSMPQWIQNDGLVMDYWMHINRWGGGGGGGCLIAGHPALNGSRLASLSFPCFWWLLRRRRWDFKKNTHSVEVFCKSYLLRSFRNDVLCMSML